MGPPPVPPVSHPCQAPLACCDDCCLCPLQLSPSIADLKFENFSKRLHGMKDWTVTFNKVGCLRVGLPLGYSSYVGQPPRAHSQPPHTHSHSAHHNRGVPCTLHNAW